ncbi:MAG TPA: efflux RND transporter periplasmic adaptor subunit [Blastocatellia bacterium]|nr:efflux RND transporter periplasmic adaptor subunit [Blastocatellia bacterium]
MMTSRFRKTLLVGLLAFVAVGAAATVKYFTSRAATDRLVLSGNIEADEIHIGSKIGGRIREVLVREGQEVKQGEPLIRFEAYDLSARRADAEAAVAQADANYQKLQNGFRPEEVAQAKAQAEAAWMTLEEARNGPRRQEIGAARAQLESANADYDVARATLARVEKLVRDGIQSKQDYDNARAAFDRASGQREAARQRLDMLLAGTRSEEVKRAERQYNEAAAQYQMTRRGSRKEDVAAAHAQLERARAALEQINTQLGELEVRAPADAFVEVLRVRPGDLINPNAPVATLVELNRLWVRVYMPEPELGYAQLGKEVTVKVDTYKNEAFKGTIEHIASRGEFTPRNVQTRSEREHQVFALRVRVDNSSHLLRAGMAADVSIMK